MNNPTEDKKLNIKNFFITCISSFINGTLILLAIGLAIFLKSLALAVVAIVCICGWLSLLKLQSASLFDAPHTEDEQSS